VTEQPAPDFAVKPVLLGEKVILRPFDADQDVPAIREMLLDPEVLKLTGSRYDPGLPVWDDDAEAKCRAWYGSRNDQPDRLDLAITDKATGECVGELVLNEWDKDLRSCNFRVLMGARGRNRGLGTEAIRMLIGYGFEQLGLHRISLDVLDFNPRARRVYEKVGFVTEGVLREAHIWENQWVDDILMAILDHEWARHRGYP
jgi:RimJ/RimL family protein N-acetyltransferase